MNRLFSIYPLKPRIQYTFRYFCTYLKDFYQILGCNRTSTPHDLKAAYLQLSLQWHPDRREDAEKENAEEKFKEISEAYYVLRDPSRRAEYDGNRLKSDSMSFTDADSMFNDFHGAPIHEVLEAIARNKRMPGMGRNIHFHMPEEVQIDSRDLEGFNINILDEGFGMMGTQSFNKRFAHYHKRGLKKSDDDLVIHDETTTEIIERGGQRIQVETTVFTYLNGKQKTETVEKVLQPERPKPKRETKKRKLVQGIGSFLSTDENKPRPKPMSDLSPETVKVNERFDFYHKEVQQGSPDQEDYHKPEEPATQKESRFGYVAPEFATMESQATFHPDWDVVLKQSKPESTPASERPDMQQTIKQASTVNYAAVGNMDGFEMDVGIQGRFEASSANATFNPLNAPPEILELQQNLRAQAEKVETPPRPQAPKEVAPDLLETAREASSSAEFKGETVHEREILDDWGGDLDKAFKRFAGR